MSSGRFGTHVSVRFCIILHSPVQGLGQILIKESRRRSLFLHLKIANSSHLFPGHLSQESMRLSIPKKKKGNCCSWYCLNIRGLLPIFNDGGFTIPKWVQVELILKICRLVHYCILILIKLRRFLWNKELILWHGEFLSAWIAFRLLQSSLTDFDWTSLKRFQAVVSKRVHQRRVQSRWAEHSRPQKGGKKSFELVWHSKSSTRRWVAMVLVTRNEAGDESQPIFAQCFSPNNTVACVSTMRSF